MNINDQFTYTDSLSSYDLVITKLAEGLYHWQVIERRTRRVQRQGEVEGHQSQIDALQCGLDALRDLRGSNPS